MTDDILKGFPVEQVHRWYNRSANSALAKPIKGQQPLSGQFLKAYVTPRRGVPVYKFTPPMYLQNNAKVIDALLFHRRVFLTEEKARLGAGGKTLQWAGLVPRLKDKRWDGIQRIALNYESLVDIAPTLADIIRVQASGTEEEIDLFTSLRGFHLRSDIEVTGLAKGALFAVTFEKWMANALDRYDFNFNEHLTLPNPDYESADPDAIRPDLKKLTVYHTNAKRMEDKGLAVAYDLEVGPWEVTNSAVKASGTVDPVKPLP